LPVTRFVLADVEAFVNSKNVSSRPTIRSRLSTLFKFCVRRKWRLDNPCYGLEGVKVLKKLPRVMLPAEAKAALEWLVKNPVDKHMPISLRPKPGVAHPGLGWFILTSFAALRPEEAMKCEPDLNLHLAAKKPFVEVTPEITKTGNWRIVYPLPPVVKALRWAMAHGSVLPFKAKAKRNLQKRLRTVLGWDRWPMDITRHSAGSAWLAMTNDQRHVIEMLGNSERIFKAHYKKPMQNATAEEYFAALKLVGG
jgi:hypothetical protein